jgi:hypothetical protein
LVPAPPGEEFRPLQTITATTAKDTPSIPDRDKRFKEITIDCENSCYDVFRRTIESDR